MSPQITEDHRQFFINDKLEFALFYDKKIKDKEKIIEDFLKGLDWKSFAIYSKVKKIIKTEVSKDLKKVFIFVEYTT